MVFNKKISFFEKKLSESIGKPKDLWKALKSLGLPNRFSSSEVSAFRIKNTIKHDGNSVLESLKNYYSTLAENLVKCSLKHAINTLLILLLNIMKI